MPAPALACATHLVALWVRSLFFRSVGLCPSSWSHAFALLEGACEVAQRQVARALAHFGDGHVGMLRHQLLGIGQAQAVDPLAERSAVVCAHKLRDVGAVGACIACHIGDGKPQLGVSLAFRPCLDALFQQFCLRIGHPARSLLLGFGSADFCLVLAVCRAAAEGRLLIAERPFHMLVEEQVVLIGHIEVYVEGNGGDNPEIDKAVGHEGEHSLAHAKDDGPVGEDGHPVDVGGCVVGAIVVEHACCAAVLLQHRRQVWRPGAAIATQNALFPKVTNTLRDIRTAYTRKARASGMGQRRWGSPSGARVHSRWAARQLASHARMCRTNRPRVTYRLSSSIISALPNSHTASQ